MKIAMYNLTTTCRFGGVETFVWEISRELARRGKDVHIIGGMGSISRNMPGVKIWRFPFWPQNRIPNFGTRFRKIGERWSFGIRAFAGVCREQYDILHIHKPYDLPFALLVKKKIGAKVVFSSHGTDFFPGDRRFLFRAAEAITSCSRFNGGQIEQRYGVKPQIIYNGIDPEIFHPLKPDFDLLQQLKVFPEKNKIILFAGRLIGLKGVRDLLQATALLQGTIPLQLVILGEGESKPALEDLGRKLGIFERLVFPGFVPNRELPRYYSFADLGVFPSVADESFGLSICEAMACGRAVVSTWVGGIPEVLLHDKTGLLAQPRNPADLADKIARLLGNDQLRRSLAEAALKRVQENFTWGRVADRLEQVYARVMKNESRHPLRMENEN